MMGKIINFSHMYESFRELSVQCICSFIDLFVGFAVQFFETFMYSNFSHTAGQDFPLIPRASLHSGNLFLRCAGPLSSGTISFCQLFLLSPELLEF